MQLLQKIQTLTDAPEGKTMHGVHFSNSPEVARHHDVVFWRMCIKQNIYFCCVVTCYFRLFISVQVQVVLIHCVVRPKTMVRLIHDSFT